MFQSQNCFGKWATSAWCLQGVGLFWCSGSMINSLAVLLERGFSSQTELDHSHPIKSWSYCPAGIDWFAVNATDRLSSVQSNWDIVRVSFLFMSMCACVCVCVPSVRRCWTADRAIHHGGLRSTGPALWVAACRWQRPWRCSLASSICRMSTRHEEWKWAQRELHQPLQVPPSSW